MGDALEEHGAVLSVPALGVERAAEPVAWLPMIRVKGLTDPVVWIHDATGG